MSWQDGAIIYLICMTGMLCALVWQANREILKLRVRANVHKVVLGVLYRAADPATRVEAEMSIEQYDGEDVET